MYELIQLTEHDYYIDCPAKIGLVKTGSDTCILIDSGNDKDAAKKVLKVLQTQNLKLEAIFNTHSHADHTGGNHLLQERTGCHIYARGTDCAVTNSPILEPVGLYGGYPFKELRHKFLMAQESKAEQLMEEVLPSGMQIIPLSGHCFDMVGFKTQDGTAYIADAVSSEDTLNKYGIGYQWDIGALLSTLEGLKNIQADRFVPAHAPVTEDIVPLVQANIESVENVIERIIGVCSQPIAFEQLLKTIFESYGLTMNAQQYVLIGSTVRSYLAYLKDKGVLDFCFSDNYMLWYKV